jgi:hypothetical protein
MYLSMTVQKTRCEAKGVGGGEREAHCYSEAIYFVLVLSQDLGFQPPERQESIQTFCAFQSLIQFFNYIYIAIRNTLPCPLYFSTNLSGEKRKTVSQSKGSSQASSCSRSYSFSHMV